jgi:hypothetical protein
MDLKSKGEGESQLKLNIKGKHFHRSLMQNHKAVGKFVLFQNPVEIKGYTNADMNKVKKPSVATFLVNLKFLQIKSLIWFFIF